MYISLEAVRSLVILLSGVSLHEGSTFYAFKFILGFFFFGSQSLSSEMLLLWEAAVPAVRGDLLGNLSHFHEAFEVSGERL